MKHSQDHPPIVSDHRRRLFARPSLAWLTFLWLVATLSGLARAAEEAAEIEKRIADSARYLTSDQLEGRGVGTKGLDLAAEYIAGQFEQAGLKTDLFDGKPMQEFKVTMGAEIGPNNKLTLFGPPGKDGNKFEPIELNLTEHFSPMVASGTGKFDLPLVFVGYGITAKEKGYDDYAGMDVKDKAVVILRHEPQQADPKSIFDGTKQSAYTPLRRKISNAFEHGAAGVIFCTDEFEARKNVQQHYKRRQQALDRLAAEHQKFKRVENPTIEQLEAQRERIDKLMREVEKWSQKLPPQYDPVLPFRASGSAQSRPNFPIVHCRRTVLDRIVTAALGTSLGKLEERIDDGPKPQSHELTGCRVAGQIDVERKELKVKNVVAVLEADGPTAEETIVLGAHYDHVGFPRRGSSDPKQRTICPGADDNASGVAVMIEIARALANREERLRRRVVFIAFTGEERGLLGSAHYVSHPLIPLEKTAAMLNLDMVGRMGDDKLTVTGASTAKQFDQLLDRLGDEHGLKLIKRPSGFGPSDHASFHAKKIAAMHFITGTHKDIHRPSDTFEKLNVPGMRRVAKLVEEVVVALAGVEERPEYVAVGPGRRLRPSGTRPYLGTVPDFAAEGPGYAFSEVAKGGPAERAGLRGGDAIIQFGDGKIGNLADVDSALRKYKAGDRVKVVVRRGQESLTFEVTLDPPR